MENANESILVTIGICWVATVITAATAGWNDKPWLAAFIVMGGIAVSGILGKLWEFPKCDCDCDATSTETPKKD